MIGGLSLPYAELIIDSEHARGIINDVITPETVKQDNSSNKFFIIANCLKVQYLNRFKIIEPKQASFFKKHFDLKYTSKASGYLIVYLIILEFNIVSMKNKIILFLYISYLHIAIEFCHVYAKNSG